MESRILYENLEDAITEAQSVDYSAYGDWGEWWVSKHPSIVTETGDIIRSRIFNPTVSGVKNTYQYIRVVRTKG